MTGTIRKVEGKRDTWEIRYDTRDPKTNKRRQYKCQFHGKKREAQEYLAQQQSLIRKGVNLDLGKTSLKDYLQKWMKMYCTKANLEYKTIESYKSVITLYVIPNLGFIAIGSLKPAHLNEYYSLMSQSKEQGGAGLSARSIVYHHRIIHHALEHAVDDEYIETNPANRAKPPRALHPHMEYLSDQEAVYILQKYKDNPIYVPIYLAISTGMRQGEIAALRWQYVDLEKATITVSSSLQRQCGTLKIKAPKTESSRRTFTISVSAVNFLKDVLAKQKALKEYFGEAYDDSGFVCSWEDGKPFDPHWISTQWSRLMASDAKITRKIRFHGLRHTYVTLNIEQGVDSKIVQQRVGHNSISTTCNTYAHVTRSMQCQAADAIERAVLSKVTPSQDDVS